MEKIEYIDNPELVINKNESTEMPFRYVKGKDGKPIMPQVSTSQVPRTHNVSVVELAY